MRTESSAASFGDGRVTLRVAGAGAHVQFDRPWVRSAMTWAMYDALAAACAAINENNDVRVAVLRGAGRNAFVAGRDIAQFRELADGMMALLMRRNLTALSTGWSACAWPASPSSKASRLGPASPSQMLVTFVLPPPARSSGFRSRAPWATAFRLPNLRRLCATLGVSWVKRMLLLAEMPTAESLLSIGYLETVVRQEALDMEVERLCNRLLEHAPLTIAATRGTLRRLSPAADIDITDLIKTCYASTDFHRAQRPLAQGGELTGRGGNRSVSLRLKFLHLRISGARRFRVRSAVYP
jgi:enoyl-CoA hydratase